jgi:translation initiation factor IF-1
MKLYKYILYKHIIVKKMVKNVNGGNKAKKQKRGYQRKMALNSTETGQMFGQVVENRGDHFAILCADNMTRMGKLSGAAKRGQRLIPGSFVVISIREYETDQKNCDIIAAGNPASDVRNIFRKINPIVGDDGDIAFYTQDDKFKEFEESEATVGQMVVINSLSELTTDRISGVNDVFGDDGDEIYKDPKAHMDQIDWDDL